MGSNTARRLNKIGQNGKQGFVEMSHPILEKPTLDELYELLDGDLDAILTPFLEQLPKLINDILLGMEAKQASAVFHAAHTLKSSAANIGGLQLSETSRQIEAFGKADELDRITPLLPQLEKHADDLKQAISDYMVNR